MTTLSRTFESAAHRESASRWERWIAKGEARDARLRQAATRVLWAAVVAGSIAAAVFLGQGL